MRHKTMAEIVAQCKARKVPYVRGKNAIHVGTPRAGYAVYIPTNGVFYGTAPSGTRFFSSSGRHDGYTWMKQLRAFFHEEVKR